MSVDLNTAREGFVRRLHNMLIYTRPYALHRQRETFLVVHGHPNYKSRIRFHGFVCFYLILGKVTSYW